MSTAVLNATMTGPARARAARPAAPVRQGRLRITARGYAVLTFLVALPLVVAAFVFATNGGGAVATDQSSHASFSYLTVQPGDTLWQLAGKIAPSADPRDVISDIEHLNQLSTSDVQPGQRLAIPAQYGH
jgi:nucleoid-associated protein YgaU